MPALQLPVHESIPFSFSLKQFQMLDWKVLIAKKYILEDIGKYCI